MVMTVVIHQNEANNTFEMDKNLAVDFQQNENYFQYVVVQY